MSLLEILLISIVAAQNVGLLLARAHDRQVCRDTFGEDATKAMRRSTT
ncbi:hypothetical protein MWU77_10540 [Rhodococcus sp. F64268]|nr:hypothetical protein [Rhodococcus sp. F64268]MCK0091217.1 hypothetical protein [Rhodococcus sp. F64268]